MNNDWLDIGVLEDYLEGKLDAKTMNRVEREALEDPFVAEALEGLSRSPKRSLQSISLLQKQLHERIAEQHQTKKRSVITWQRLSIAAAAAVMFVSVSIMFWLKENNRQQQMAAQPKKVEVNLAPADSTRTKTEKPEVLAKVKEKPAPAGISSEIDRAIAAAKTNAYASNKKIKPTGPLNSGAEIRAMRAPAAAPATIETQAADKAAFRVMEKASDKNMSTDDPKASLYAPQGEKASIYLSAKDVPQRPVLQGQVVSAQDGLPVQGASVKVAGTPYQAVTDSKGQFSLVTDSGTLSKQLNVSGIGYLSQVVNNNLNKPVMIRLNEDTKSLSEVVVVKNARSRKEKTDDTAVIGTLNGKLAGVTVTDAVPIEQASPVGGWKDFMYYLGKNNRLKHDGKSLGTVEVGFTIAKNGKPKDIKVVKSVSEACDQEAIRLIEEGPKWIRPAKGSAYTTVLVVF